MAMQRRNAAKRCVMLSIECSWFFGLYRWQTLKCFWHIHPWKRCPGWRFQSLLLILLCCPLAQSCLYAQHKNRSQSLLQWRDMSCRLLMHLRNTFSLVYLSLLHLIIFINEYTCKALNAYKF